MGTNIYKPGVVGEIDEKAKADMLASLAAAEDAVSAWCRMSIEYERKDMIAVADPLYDAAKKIRDMVGAA